MKQATVLHAAALAAIHGGCFPPAERWDAAAMATMLAMPGAFALLDAGGGFILARTAADETEVLTVAVLPDSRRRGIARRLLDAVCARVACPVFLEVEAGNAAAVALYRAAGFRPVGCRRHYYGAGRDALVLRRDPVGVTCGG